MLSFLVLAYILSKLWKSLELHEHLQQSWQAHRHMSLHAQLVQRVQQGGTSPQKWKVGEGCDP